MLQNKKRIISLILMLTLVIASLASFAIVSSAEETAGAYTLVTDVSELAVGDSIVIVAKGYDYALSTTQNNNNRAQAAVTKSGDTITFGSDVQVLTLEAGTVEGTFAFNTGSGYLYAASNSSNHLKTQETNDDEGSWKITIDSEGIATIIAQGKRTRNWLRYNSTSSLFSCYASGQQDVCIYKYVDSSVPSVEYNATFEVPTGATTPDAITGSTITLPDAVEAPKVFNKYNYEFAGWAEETIDNAGSEPELYEAGESVALKEDTVFYAVYSYSESGVVDHFEKVSETPAGWRGTYLIVYEVGNVAFNGGLEKLDASSNTIEITITDGSIESNDTTNAAVFTIDENGYIKSASGYYIGQTSDTNGLKSSNSTTYENTISLNDDGTVNIVSGGAYLRYNAASDQLRFRYYKSGTYTGQKAICLYKFVTGTRYTTTLEHEHSYEDVVTKPTCTESGYTTHTCSACGDSYTDNEVGATGHIDDGTGNCYSCGEKIVAKIGDVYYVSFADALANAAENDSIVLVSDVEYSTEGENEVILLTKGVEIDLNGHTLVAAGFISFTVEGRVVDNGETKGLLKVPNGNLVMSDAAYPMLPVWNDAEAEADQGYVFVEVKDQHKYQEDESVDGKVVIDFRPALVGADHFGLFGEEGGASDNQISIKIRIVTYDATSGEVIDNGENKTYTVSDELIQNVYINKSSIRVTIVNASAEYVYGIELVIESDTGIAYVSEMGKIEGGKFEDNNSTNNAA